jgi:C-terminal processing protease CtpA/Prc
MLTAAERTAIALKAVATRRARLAASQSGGTIVFGEPSTGTATVKVAEPLPDLKTAEIVQYYDDGWRAARLASLGPEKATLYTIPAYGKQPHKITVNRADIRAIEQSKRNEAI